MAYQSDVIELFNEFATAFNMKVESKGGTCSASRRRWQVIDLVGDKRRVVEHPQAAYDTVAARLFIDPQANHRNVDTERDLIVAQLERNGYV